MIKVTIGDNFPQLICQECFGLLEKIILFRRTCVESEIKLYQACSEDPDILENKPETSSSLPAKVEPLNELPDKINQESPIKTEEECLPLKVEIDVDKNEDDGDLDFNYLSNNDSSDSDYQPLINIKNKKEPKQTNKKKKINKKQYYECEYKCGKTIVSHLAVYERHLERIHKPTLKKCPTCPKTMYSEVFFQKHITKHADLTCPYCQKLFQQQKVFDKHLPTHGFRAYACPSCNGTYQTKTVRIF